MAQIKSCVIFLLFFLMSFQPILGTPSPNKTVNIRFKFDNADLRTGLEKFKATYNRYPTNEEGLSILIRCTNPALCAKYFPPDGFISKYALNDPWDTAYTYHIDSKNIITLNSLGSDGKPGGQGCAQDINIATEKYLCNHLDRFDFFEFLKGYLLFLPIITLMLPLLIGWHYFQGKVSYWLPISILFSILLAGGSLFLLLMNL